MRINPTKSTWWRWPLILPAAIFGYFIIQSLAWIVLFWAPDKAVELVNALLAPISCIMLGTQVAPSKRAHVALALLALNLVLQIMVMSIIVLSGQSLDLYRWFLHLIGSIVGFYLAKTGKIRTKIGFLLFSLLAIGANVMPWVIFLSIIVGIWWPIIKIIIGSPLWAFLLIPVGFIVSGFSFWLHTLIYGLITFPILALAGWLVQDDVKDATEDFDQTLAFSPQDSYHYFNRGLEYLGLDQYERVIQDYDETIRLDPQYAWAYGNRGIAYKNMGKSLKQSGTPQRPRNLVTPLSYLSPGVFFSWKYYPVIWSNITRYQH